MDMVDLDWQNGFTQIKMRGQYLLQTEKWADCRFLVGVPPNQREIAGHKLILAMGSPVFERMFYGNFSDKADPIIIPDVQPDAFQAMLEYIYSDRINISSFDKACELCYVAKKYMLPHVVEQCTQFLWADLSPKNACRAYEFAKLFDEPRLMHSSMELIAANTREVLNDPAFLDIEVPTLMAILDQDKLNIDSELDLFDAIVRFARERGICTEEYSPLPNEPRLKFTNEELPPLDMSSSTETISNAAIVNEKENVEEIKMEPDVAAMMHNHVDNVNEGASNENENVNYDLNDSAVSQCVGEVFEIDSDASGAEADSVASCSIVPSVSNASTLEPQRMIVNEAMLREAVKKIRFLTLTPQQFAEGPARSKLLQQHEALAILIKISSPTLNDYAMPEGFCNSRCSRNYYEPRCQRELSSFVRPPRPPQGAEPRCQRELSSYPNYPRPSQAARTSHLLHPVSEPETLPCDDWDEATNDTRRSYCVRTIRPQFDYRNTSVTDCGLTFQVDTNVWITGVQVPTQVLCGELMNSAGFSERYTEILYAHVQDMQGSRLTYTHCTSRVRYDSLLEISFDRPAYIYRNQIYKVYVVFNKVGWYPMYSCNPNIVCNRVRFMFNVGSPAESVRDGLIRAIVFSTPQQSQMLGET